MNPAPSDRDAERAVLGACMLSRDAIDDTAGVLTPRDFYAPAHELVFTAVLALRDRGEPVDAVTVTGELDRVGVLPRVGGAAYVHELVSVVPTASNAGWYADQVAEKSTLRSLTAAGTRITQLGCEPVGDVNDTLTAAGAALAGVRTKRRELVSHETALYAAVEELNRETSGYPTPWAELTDAVGGWVPGRVYYVGARPGQGKTMLGIGAALDVARRGVTALIASLEMSKTEIYHRMLSTYGVDSARIMHRRLTRADHEKLAEAAGSLARLPLAVDDDPSQRVSTLRARARDLDTDPMRPSLGLIVVDYVQLMSSGKRVENRQQEVAAFSRELKMLARERNVPVLALSQLNRGVEGRADKRPGLSDFRESGALEQDGDVCLLLHHDTDNTPDDLHVHVAKNRHGPSGQTIRLRWEAHFSRLTEWGPRAWTPSQAAH